MASTKGSTALALEQKQQAQQDMEVRKAVEAIAISPKRGKLTLLGRRIFNVLLFHAQDSSNRVGENLFEIPLGTLITDASFESNNTAVLKDNLREMVSTTVEWNSPGKSWEVANLLASAKLTKTEGSNTVTLQWSYAASVVENLLRPDVYTRLTLRMNNVWRTVAAASLWEIAVRYRTNYGGLTMRERWQWWVPVLTGNGNIDASQMEYKYFKRDVLVKAIAEVNAEQDEIVVELIEHKGLRKKIEDIQFKITESEQRVLDLAAKPADNLFNPALITEMMKLGVSEAEAVSFSARYDEAQITSAIDYTKRRVAKKTDPVSSTAAYFKSSLANNYGNASSAPSPAPPENPKLGNDPAQGGGNKTPDSPHEQMQAIKDKYLLHRRDSLKVEFESWPQENIDAAISEFEVTQIPTAFTAVKSDWEKRKQNGRIASNIFFSWLMELHYPEPTPEELFSFALGNGLLKLQEM
jgi:hypothetical protein